MNVSKMRWIDDAMPRYNFRIFNIDDAIRRHIDLLCTVQGRFYSHSLNSTCDRFLLLFTCWRRRSCGVWRTFLSEWLLVVELGTDICQEEVEKGSNSFFYWRSLLWTEIKIEAFFNIEQFYEPQMPHIAIMLLLNKTKITRRSKWETNWSTLCRHYGRHRHYHDILLEKWSRK